MGYLEDILTISSYWLLVIGYRLHKHLEMCSLWKNINLFISTRA